MLSLGEILSFRYEPLRFSISANLRRGKKQSSQSHNHTEISVSTERAVEDERKLRPGVSMVNLMKHTTDFLSVGPLEFLRVWFVPFITSSSTDEMMECFCHFTFIFDVLQTQYEASNTLVHITNLKKR